MRALFGPRSVRSVQKWWHATVTSFVRFRRFLLDQRTLHVVGLRREKPLVATYGNHSKRSGLVLHLLRSFAADLGTLTFLVSTAEFSCVLPR